MSARQGAPPPAPPPGARPWTLVLVLVLLVGGLMNSAVAAGAPDVAMLATADGARLRVAAWRPEGPPRGTVVLLTGRCEYLEKYQEVAGDWLSRGFQVFSLDWRGQGLSSRLLPDRQKCHITDYAVHVADMALWLDTVVRPREVGPTVLVAHSMGGLIGLRYLIDHPGRFAAAVLTSPMVDINTDPWPRFVAEMLSRSAGAFGFSGSYAFGQSDYDPSVDGAFEGNAVTSDPARFRGIHDGYRANPDLRLGGVTFGWLTASFRAQAIVAMPGALQDVRLPVLLLTAPHDQLVPSDTQALLCRRLHDCVNKLYPEARHDILAETDGIRARAWRDIDAFLAPVLSASGK